MSRLEAVVGRHSMPGPAVVGPRLPWTATGAGAIGRLSLGPGAGGHGRHDAAERASARAVQAAADTASLQSMLHKVRAGVRILELEKKN
jgi:hypothetical protein